MIPLQSIPRSPGIIGGELPQDAPPVSGYFTAVDAPPPISCYTRGGYEDGFAFFQCALMPGGINSPGSAANDSDSSSGL
jgi:hypothetical protein